MYFFVLFVDNYTISQRAGDVAAFHATSRLPRQFHHSDNLVGNAVNLTLLRCQ